MIASLRPIALAALCATSGAALAENYTAHIYGVPGGFAKMQVTGAGDNVMMTGFLSGPGGPFAAYLTNSGYKNINPAGWDWSEINGSWGSTYHCGRGSVGGLVHALYWVGGGAGVDLHPTGAEYTSSTAFGGGGQFQVGEVRGTIDCAECGFVTTLHAGLWSRTSASFKRLHSTTHNLTQARGTDGTRVVGAGQNRNDHSVNALLWNSVSSMAINIRPSMSTFSSAASISGNQQCGSFIGPQTGGASHAVLWTGTAASAVDLNPNSTFNRSEGLAVRNGLQVGYATPITNTSRPQAIAWHGTAASWINLHARLPIVFQQQWRSIATAIDSAGNIVGYVENMAGTELRPVIWIRS
jgi:hypothetical protein